ncbi:NB-ARC [Arabidopsis suecica]|uniref:ADP-ribosyl cyclase/cyclic ADP-ribose hydrolase n=1 Tax=Arabidopsis suecica TaxID=45249 RepID=A0A8T1ZUQ3_ARASU|nr:NB-ARC [Arabidopsis suecica]
MFAEDILKAYNVWKARGNFLPDADKKIPLVFVAVAGLRNSFQAICKTVSLDFQVKLMCSYCKKHNDKFVPDPYYGGAQVAAAISFFMIFTKFRFQQDNKDTKSSSSLSLPSPPASLSRKCKHHVFPSFFGPDVRRPFLSHILVVFKGKGIDPFIDNHIPRSKSIGPELIEAIRGSKIAIVLLSKNYASSSWCLDELAEIMKCREVLGQIVMTIFYEVEPTNIKKQIGDFGKAFRKTCKGKPKEHIERWRKALEDVAKIAGEHSPNWGNEAAMIEKIVTDVSNMLNNSTPSRDFDGLVGMRAHMEMMERLLRLDLNEVRMIGIWGPPGIGKTTIARFLFNQLSNRFELGAIMVDIKGCYPRPCLDEYNAQLQLQKQMLSQIINQKDIMISHLGVAQERLKDKKVFLVLDDVDLLGQLNALAKEIQWFGPGSRIIITTEDLRVLKNAHKINHIYKVKFPSRDEAFQIFCMHAFGQNHPDDGFFKLAWEVTCLAGKLPLGLKVLGSTMRGMSKPEWERILPRLKTCLDGEIKSIIKFSYDALCEEDKYLFLYIACLFNYQLVYKVEEVLENKFLDVRQVLSDDTIDSRRFIGINLKLSITDKDLNISEKEVERMSDLQFVRIQGNTFERLQSLLYHNQKLRLLDWSNFQNICLPSTFNPEFLVELNLQDSKLQKLWEGNKVLNLHSCSSLVKIPSSIMNVTDLWRLDLSDCSNLVELPSIGNATKLELLNLNNCSNLVKLPSSINATNLYELFLKNCSRVVELPAIKSATNLWMLDLNNCSSLLELPLSIGNATNLKELDISGCSSLVKLPSSIGDIPCLQDFNLSNCSSLVELPSSIGNLQKLSVLTMCGCSKLEALPTNINLKSLSTLDLTDCSQLKSFPEISTNIENLRLKGTAVKEVPLSIMSWSRLSYFQMSYFESLKEFPHAFNIITELHLVSDEYIQEVAPWVKGMSRLRKLRLYNCNNLIRLHFTKCFKLNQEAGHLIMHASTSRYGILPGTQVPACFNHRATAGGLLAIKLNESPLPTTLRFKACIMLVKGNQETGDDQSLMAVYIDIMDKQNDLKQMEDQRMWVTSNLGGPFMLMNMMKASEMALMEEGNMADSRIRSAAKRRGIEITSLSRPIKASDFRKYDHVLAMDEQHSTKIMWSDYVTRILQIEMGLVFGV